ncbi:glycosyltransferase family 4 protein [Actinocrispum sp. NPDC049592]|uniref:glycosyltransferase family 4 protein n=1 Tax=Actinocrispum sp. NPDC049592 TaxID=3154835 RepID=UPI00342196A0
MTSVLVTFGAYPGTHSGAERMGWRTAEHLARHGCDLTVVTDSPPAADVRVLPAGSHAPADLVHAFDLGKPAAVEHGRRLAQRYGVPFALTPATDSSVWPDPAGGDRLCRQADVVFSITGSEDKALVGKGVDPGRIVRIPMAPDLTGTPDPAAFRRTYGVNGPLVLFVGRRVAFKGYRRLLESMPLVWRAVPETVFAFAGANAEPGAAAAFERRADRRLLDLGVVHEHLKRDAIAAADLLCLPSSADVFPVVFAEAWSMAKPVVSGDFPGAREVVRHTVDGLVVQPRPDVIAAALTELITDSARRTAMGLEGLRRAERELSWTAVATRVSAAYHKLLR